ncbi:hypothetical protein SAMN05444921_121190 [Streptomyces wuyuanensis]|uniref:Uncharacterized protein n=2 Tax=Streptomyces wuyuanensis TaxID=1196353 RepID=A0A1G9ZI96_9ACTN|nr:hypothetical protein SAMN05444921_121190 [Streptomyces wuyuanensis]
MVRLRDLIFEMPSLPFSELGENGGMAVDGEGRAFATVYKEAVKTVCDKAGFAHQVMANGAGALAAGALWLVGADGFEPPTSAL